VALPYKINQIPAIADIACHGRMMGKNMHKYSLYQVVDMADMADIAL
jgi:hypothetical protein